MSGQVEQVEARLKLFRMVALAVGAAALRFTFDPKGAVLQMAKNKELFKDDKDERVILAREGVRWAGILLFAMACKAYSLLRVDYVTGTLPEQSAHALRVLGVGLVLDGVIAKWFGFYRSGVFTFIDSAFVGAFDVSMGLALLFGLPN